MAKRTSGDSGNGAAAARKPQAVVDPAEGVGGIRSLNALIIAHLGIEPVDWRAVARAARKLSKTANSCARWRGPVEVPS